MARYGILSDIHGNLEALRTAVAFLQGEGGVDELLCLGDIVGYNAEPDACVELVRELGVASIAGNHDLIAIGALGFERCALRPRFALQRTRQVVSEATRQALRTLPCRRVVEDEVVLMHGGFRDVCQYVTTPDQVQENHARMLAEVPRARICFFGHTHAQKLYEVHRGVATERAAEGTVALDAPGRTYFVNPGSVDAARKEDRRLAEVAIFDSWRRTVSFHRVPYDHERAERWATEQGYRMTAAGEQVRSTLRTLERSGRGAMRRLRRLVNGD